MNPFKSRSTWQRVDDAARDAGTKTLARTALAAVGALAGASVVSAMVSAARERAERS